MDCRGERVAAKDERYRVPRVAGWFYNTFVWSGGGLERRVREENVVADRPGGSGNPGGTVHGDVAEATRRGWVLLATRGFTDVDVDNIDVVAKRV